MTILRGIVTKAGVMEKTVTVTVERKIIHPKLLKVRPFFSLSFSSPFFSLSLWNSETVG
jgi:hypothetical protein